MTSSKKITEFRRIVWNYWKKNGRHDLPWRKITDPYKILVSEMMLQQTQVPRVIEKYKSFIKKFPNVRALATAPLSEVLKEWSGLGYNRRGKYLRDAAKVIFDRHSSDIKEALNHPLPGVGPYTRAAVRTFAFNEPHAMIETNIRCAFMHKFYSMSDIHISDKEILPIAILAAKGQNPRRWHWALMDYGAYLKKSGVRNNSQSKHYTKQSRFEGSLRQIRGEVLRQLHEGKQPRGEASRLGQALKGLERDGLIKKEKGKWRVS